MIKVKIKRFDDAIPLPEYHSKGAAAMDLSARKQVKISPGEVGYVPLNVALQIPAGHFVLLSARSSLHKKGLLLANGIGVGDSDFSGDGDEYKAALLNFSNKSATIKKGDRLVQMMVLPVEPVQFEEVKKFDTKDRGGFGSTGGR